MIKVELEWETNSTLSISPKQQEGQVARKMQEAVE
jgi:hypothetical protein